MPRPKSSQIVETIARDFFTDRIHLPAKSDHFHPGFTPKYSLRASPEIGGFPGFLLGPFPGPGYYPEVPGPGPEEIDS